MGVSPFAVESGKGRRSLCIGRLRRSMDPYIFLKSEARRGVSFVDTHTDERMGMPRPSQFCHVYSRKNCLQSEQGLVHHGLIKGYP